MFINLCAQSHQFFEGLEYEASVALEDFNSIEWDKALQIEACRDRIATVGMSKESYLALESLHPGILTGVDKRKLTSHPSKSMQTVAVEAVNGSSFFSKFSNSGGVVNFFMTFIDWLVGKVTGHGSLGLTGRLSEGWVKGRTQVERLHEYETDVTNRVIKYKSDQVFTSLIETVAKGLSVSEDRNASEIASAMVEYSTRSPGHAVIPLIALARTAIRENCSVNDYRAVAKRLIDYRLMKSHPSQTAGLAATRQGLPSAILIGSVLDIDTRMSGELANLSKQYARMAKELGSMPMTDTGVEGWLRGCEKATVDFDKAMSNSKDVTALVDKWDNDANFSQTLGELQTGTIGFWYDVHNMIQGERVYDPDEHIEAVRRIFEMNRDGSVAAFSSSVETAMAYLQEATQSISRVDGRRLDRLVTNGTSESARLRALVKTFRSDATTLLRIARVLEAYVNGTVRAFKTVKPFRKSFEGSAGIFFNTPIKV